MRGGLLPRMGMVVQGYGQVDGDGGGGIEEADI